jgi:hypothetical protein
MANESKRKGTSHETAVVRFLKPAFPYVERRALAGNSDRGDIAGIPGLVIECKAEKRIDLAGYMDEVRQEVKNAGAQLGVAVVKRRNHPIERAYVVMELADFVEVIK